MVGSRGSDKTHMPAVGILGGRSIIGGLPLFASTAIRTRQVPPVTQLGADGIDTDCEISRAQL